MLVCGRWQGELIVSSDVSHGSRTEIASAAAPKNPLSLELLKAVHHMSSGSSGKQQLTPRPSAGQPKIES